MKAEEMVAIKHELSLKAAKLKGEELYQFYNQGASEIIKRIDEKRAAAEAKHASA